MDNNTNNKDSEDEKSSKECDDYWEKEKQIKFSIATKDDVKEMQYMFKNEFIPDEPVFSNSGMNFKEGSVGGWFHRKMEEYVDKECITDVVTKYDHAQSCIIARSTVTGNLVGLRVGKIVSRKDKVKKFPRMDWAAKLPKFLSLPHWLVFDGNIGPLFEKLRVGHEYIFVDLEDADMVYECMFLSVGKEARGKGLGTELIRRGYKIAKKAGCQYTYVGATSDYTKRILEKLGNSKVIHEAKYEDYRYDKKGRPFLTDTGVHQSFQTVLVDHRNKEDSS